LIQAQLFLGTHWFHLGHFNHKTRGVLLPKTTS